MNTEKMSLEKKEILVNQIIGEMKKVEKLVYLPEVENCIFLSLMKLNDEELKKLLDK